MTAKPRVLFVMKGPGFYRSTFLDHLTEHFDVTAVFTTRPSEVVGRHHAHFADTNTARYRSVYVRGVKFGKFKVGLEMPRELRETYDAVVVCLLDDIIALQFLEFCLRTGREYLMSLDGVGRRNRTLDLVFGRYLRGAKACLSPSAATDEMIVELAGNALPLRRYTLSSIAAAAVDETVLASHQKAALRGQLGLPTDMPTIVSVGQMVPRKGPDVLIAAMREVSRPCSVVFVGGEPSQDLVDLVEAQGSPHRYSFVAYVPPEMVASYYRMSDVFAMPTRGDSWGLVVIEAMSHGLPVVTTTACGAGVELVDQSVGVLIDPDDPPALGRALQALLDDADGTADRAQASLEKARSCTIEEMSLACGAAVREFSSLSVAN